MRPLYDEQGIVLYHADCRAVLPTLAAGSVDLVLTDPPYNVGKRYGQHNDTMAPLEYEAWLRGILTECARISRGNVVFFPGCVNVFGVDRLLEGTGLRPYRMLGWHRKEFAGDKWTSGPSMCWEPIIWASSAERPAFNKRFGTWGRDFFVVNATHGDPLAQRHPCPKPFDVVRWLLGLFCPERGSLLDPFAGTGTTLRAAKDVGCEAIGIECEAAYCAVAIERLAQGVLLLAGG